MQNNEERIVKITKWFLQSDDSPYARFVNSGPPANDAEYLTMWFTFLKKSSPKSDFFTEMLDSHWRSTEDFFLNIEFRHSLKKRVMDEMDKALHKRIGEMAFTPRLEMYLETFQVDEQEILRKLLLGYLGYLADKKPIGEDNLVEIANEVQVDMGFVLTMDEGHRFFADKVMELEDSRYRDNKPFLHQDITRNITILKIFSGYNVPERELISLRGSILISLFDLGPIEPADAPDISLGKTGKQKPAFGEDDEIETSGIDELLKRLEMDDEDDEDDDGDFEVDMEDHEGDEFTGHDDEKEKDADSASKNGLSEELMPYKDDLDYLFSEFEWIKTRVELIKHKNDTFSFDRDDKKKALELEQKWKKQKQVCEIRLQKSATQKFRPRLEKLGDMIGLDENERNLLKLLTVNSLFSIEDRYSSTPDVGSLMRFLFENPIDRVHGKKIFLKNAKLVKSGIIQLGSRGIEKNLFECDVIIDNRLIEYLIGEDYNISDYVEGSVLYKPATPLNQCDPARGRHSQTACSHYCSERHV